MASGIENVVIIGSGPAGWTAAIYAARANLRPVVYVGVPATNPAPVLPGGQLMLTTEVENYPGFPHGVTGPDMMGKFREQAERFGTRVVDANIDRCDFSKRPFTLTDSDGKSVQAQSVIISTGATANWLGIPNELRLAQNGGGVSACAVCDGALPAFRNQPLMKGLTFDTNVGRRGQAALAATSTLLFASGQTADNKPHLFGIDKKTGKRVGAVAVPRTGGYGLMTYLHQGKQYVVIPVNGGYTTLALP